MGWNSWYLKSDSTSTWWLSQDQRSDPSRRPYNHPLTLIMYEDLTNESFEADGEFWESIQVPWDDYDDYLPKEELNTTSSYEYDDPTEGNDVFIE